MIPEYRAWIKDSYRYLESRKSWPRMVKVHSIHFGTKKIIVSDGKYGNVSIPFEDIELMQFTGLFDENGNKIFEGDLVRAVSPWNRVQKVIMVGHVSYNLYGFWELAKIKATVWKGFSAGVEPNDSVPLSSLAVSYELEVIGNIYDNPTLIAS